MGLHSTMYEILAPAGDINSAFAAINAGTDAVYIGLKEYSARSSAENFDTKSFGELVGYAHAFGVKVYVAMNTLIKNEELSGFLQSAVKVWNAGADAIIISDVFVGAFLKHNYPQMVIHLSTQAGVCNKYGALFAKECGFSRVILARETAFEDIKEISSIIETEVFIQGALCSCFSGQCYLSSFAGGNSGNRGKCKQPCRKLYSVDKDGFEEPSYKLSLSDLNIGEDIKLLLEAGVYSFKIEGRMRRPEYVSAAVKYYKNILNGNPVDNDLSDLKRTFNRGNYTKGLAFGQDKTFLSNAVQGHIGEFVGIVKVENGKYICQSRQNFGIGDGFKILRDGREVGGASFGGTVKTGFVLSTKARLKNGDKVFVTTDTQLNAHLLKIKKLISLRITAKFMAGKKAEVCINGKLFYSDEPLALAQSRPLSKEEIENCFRKVDKYPFTINFCKFESDGVFVPASALNALRRKVFSAYFESISENNNVQIRQNYIIPEIKIEKNEKTAIICDNLCGLSVDIGILKLNDFNADVLTLLKDFKGEKYLFLPPYLSGREAESVKCLINYFDGIYCDGIYGFKLAEEIKKPLFVGTGMNTSNNISVSACKAKYFALSKELTVSEAKVLSKNNSFYLVAGGIKVMDLIFCPFGKKCKTCDKREHYMITDENGRKFYLHRYKTSDCRFEVYNCANLVSTIFNAGNLLDCTLEKQPKKLLDIYKNEEKLREYYKNYTRGHSVQPIF